ncbi:unnamed protein product, partial [Pleuronectes platessa]
LFSAATRQGGGSLKPACQALEENTTQCFNSGHERQRRGPTEKSEVHEEHSEVPGEGVPWRRRRSYLTMSVKTDLTSGCRPSRHSLQPHCLSGSPSP